MRGVDVDTTTWERARRFAPVRRYPWEVVSEFLNRLDAEPRRIKIGPKTSPSAISRTFVEAARFRNIESVDCGGSRVLDDHLQLLTKWPELAGLTLSDTRISNGGLRSLANCPKLKGLSLVNTQIDDDGLEILSHMKGLVWLHLGQTQVTDTGLPLLGRLQHLEYLWVGNTRVTYQALSRLEAQCPNLNPNRPISF